MTTLGGVVAHTMDTTLDIAHTHIIHTITTTIHTTMDNTTIHTIHMVILTTVLEHQLE